MARLGDDGDAARVVRLLRAIHDTRPLGELGANLRDHVLSTWHEVTEVTYEPRRPRPVHVARSEWMDLEGMLNEAWSMACGI